MGKRTRRLLLILTVMVFVLAGCKKEVGSPQDNAIVPEKSEEEERPEYKFGFTCITMENPYLLHWRQQSEEKWRQLALQ